MSTVEKLKTADNFWVRRTTLAEADRSFDIAFWQAQSPEARLAAAADMMRTVDAIKGRAGERRLERCVIVKYVRGSSGQQGK